MAGSDKGRLLQRSVEWSKQNLADSILEARDVRVRDVDEGRAYLPADGVLSVTRWTAAGSPDYPWLFATDGEYTAFASVAAEQFDIVRAHLRARDASDLPNDGSGKVIREMAFTGDVYFGSNSGAGNTDETAAAAGSHVGVRLEDPRGVGIRRRRDLAGGQPAAGQGALQPGVRGSHARGGLPPAEVSLVELDGDQVRVTGHPGTNELVITLR